LLPIKDYSDNHIKKNDNGQGMWHVWGKPEGQSPLEKLILRWEDKITLDLQ
jgi:hypothetical protein